jgi:hypothetical protein
MAAAPQTAAFGQPDAMAISMGRMLMRTSAPIFHDFEADGALPRRFLPTND